MSYFFITSEVERMSFSACYHSAVCFFFLSAEQKSVWIYFGPSVSEKFLLVLRKASDASSHTFLTVYF